MEIIQERRRIETPRYAMDYSYADEPGAGFTFDCDAAGNIDESQLQPAGLANLAACRAGAVDGRPVTAKLASWVDRYTEPAKGRCACGRAVTLRDPLDNTCECGMCFNMSGQQVIPSWLCDEQGEPIDY